MFCFLLDLSIHKYPRRSGPTITPLSDQSTSFCRSLYTQQRSTACLFRCAHEFASCPRVIASAVDTVRFLIRSRNDGALWQDVGGGKEPRRLWGEGLGRLPLDFTFSVRVND